MNYLKCLEKNEVMVAITLTLVLVIFLVVGYLKSEKLKKENKGVEVVCKTCKGTGETEQDVNLLMAKAAYSIWFNSHSKNCEACKKFPDGEPCSIDRKKYEEIMNNYKKLGPKMDMAACPDCMGMGSYKQFKGYRFGKEKLSD